MYLTLEIPDDIAGRLGGGEHSTGNVASTTDDLSRRALESFGLEEYKAGRITKAELRRVLGFTSRYELDGFLKAREVWVEYTIEEFHRELEDLKRLGF